jgi:hypothetical protein
MLRIRQNTALFLLVCFLPVITPKEFIHSLFGHEDTHCLYHSDLTIGTVHRHCSILQITSSTFVHEHKALLQGKIIHLIACFIPDQSFISEISFHISFLRAPPALVF